MEIKESEKLISVAGKFDVCVCGGGIAGVAAALAAARSGAKTLLIEKSYMLGGLATAGLVTIYLPLCDGKGRQVSFGIVEELLRLSVKYGYEVSSGKRSHDGIGWLYNCTSAARKEYRFTVQFNAAVFSILCEKILQEEGVEILFGTSVCAADVQTEKIRAVITENKSGRQAFCARSFVDATGDADLCKLSGASTVEFQHGNVLAYWYYEHFDTEYRLQMKGFADHIDRDPTPEALNQKHYTGLSGKELSDMTQDAHRKILDDFLERGNVSASHALASIATTPQIRMTRRLDGLSTLAKSQSFTAFDDSIGMIGSWRERGPVYEIPMSSLCSKEIKNLSACGRCFSVDEPMWDISRVIPSCAVTGQAAGTAAAMTDDLHALNIRALQNKLVADGVKLHIADLPEVEE